MAIVRKRIATPGQYTARDHSGQPCGVQITAARIDGWLAKGRRMLAEGIRVPVCWGHQFAALPTDPLLDNAHAYLNAVYRAGDVVAFNKSSDGGLDVVIDAPGLSVQGGNLVATARLDDGRMVPTAIREVSPLIGLNWIDGKGREWRDIIGHVALTPYPVQFGQPGFQALSADPGRARGGVYLSARPSSSRLDPAPLMAAARALCLAVHPRTLERAIRSGVVPRAYVAPPTVALSADPPRSPAARLVVPPHFLIAAHARDAAHRG